METSHDAAADRLAARVAGTIVAVADFDASDRDAAYALLATYYGGTDRARFERDLDEKDHIVVLRDAGTGALAGFCTVRTWAHQPAGSRRPVTVLFTGDTVVDRAYWGQKELHAQISRLILRARLRHPLRPFYWLLISKGYKTYKIVVRASPRAVPRHDRATPPTDRRLLDELGHDRFGDRYDAAAGVIRSDETDYVRDGAAQVTDQLLASDPHVAFFVARNPGHAAGDELACLAPLAYRDLLSTLLSSARARSRSRSRSRRRPG